MTSRCDELENRTLCKAEEEMTFIIFVFLRENLHLPSLYKIYPLYVTRTIIRTLNLRHIAAGGHIIHLFPETPEGFPRAGQTFSRPCFLN